MTLGTFQIGMIAVAAIASANFSARAANGAEPKTDPMQIARGAQAWAQNCGRCHNLREPGALPDERHDVTIAHMRVRANLPGQVARDIAAFLKASN